MELQLLHRKFKEECVDFARRTLTAGRDKSLRWALLLELVKVLVRQTLEHCSGALQILSPISKLLLESGHLIADSCSQWRDDAVRRLLQTLRQEFPYPCTEFDEVLSDSFLRESIEVRVSSLLLEDSFAIARAHATSLLPRCSCINAHPLMIPSACSNS